MSTTSQQSRRHPGLDWHGSPLRLPTLHAGETRRWWLFADQRRRLRQAVRTHLDGIVWRAAAIGLIPNLILRPNRFPPASLRVGRAYLSGFWSPATAGEWLDVAVAILGWPLGVPICALWFTHRNGAVVAERFGRSRVRQLGDQLGLAVTSGLLPPWYYIFDLYRPGRMELARCYLTRGQTKRGAYRILAKAHRSSSPLGDKEAFALYCAERGIAALPVLLSVHDGELRGAVRSGADLPEADLFVKPVRARGGRGAERWDHAGKGIYRHRSGQHLSAAEFLDRLRAMSRWQPYLVQERALNHPAMGDLSNGALSTIRMLSCLDEENRPEIIAAVLRMAVGSNVTVDNVHAGGLAAAVDIGDGRLSQATDMGIYAKLGWIDRHPDTGGRIGGRILPLWDEVCGLVRKAHSAFNDRVVVGWDVAIMAAGPRLVEGNSGPDIDLVQRPLGIPFGNARFGELLAHHLDRAEMSKA